MKFTCTQENLIQGLTMVSHVTGKNVNLPILGNALLKTENGNLKLSSTNLEIAVSCLVRGKVDQEGEYSIPAKLLMDYVSLLPSGKVELTLTEEGLEIGSNGQETIIKGMPANEFPLLPKLSKGEGYRLSAPELKLALGQVTFAASTSESRPELMGVACFFGIGDGSKEAIIAATDSYRLAERKMSLTGGPNRESRTIVPARSMIEISRIVSSYKDDVSENTDVTWTFTENQLVVTFGNVELVTRLIEGTFPPYQDIIPKEFKTEAVVPRSELQKAVRAASLFSRQGLFDVHLAFDAGAGTCSVASADQGTGKTKTDVKGNVTGAANKATLNYRYVMDGLSAMQTENVRIVLIDDNNPILLLPESAGEAYRYLVMPIRQ
ncbi:DNA polymerase III subunit beta [Patescibacteria group bacterium]|nr:DNA polymerase III subunit beta [Patescibacteria group bacterium]MBU1448692.1 DNA polymerase III subunit beta [Patescibacteria group bacterium]MBU2613337.1 DNA polymerase III subunit beta [Patescibacteria group bacterium]